MKIGFVNPPWMLGQHFKRFERVASIQQPLGLAYLAAVLESQGHEVKIVEAAAQRMSHEEILAEIRDFSPEVVGLTAVTPGYDETLRLAASLKEVRNVPIIIGGPHVTALPEETLQNSCFDYAVLGEGEATIAELVNAIQEGETISRIGGVAFRKGNGVVRTEPRPFIDVLDNIPFPARHLLPPLSSYQPTPSAYRCLPQATVISSRGCPYRCAFCDRSVFGNRYRARSARNVVDEVELLVGKYGAREVRFWDDTFNIDQQRVLDICAELLTRGIEVPWTCLGRVNHMNQTVLNAMAKAGCWQVDYGIESGNQCILDGITKGQTLDLVQKTITMTRKAGISVRGFFMIGLPGETESTMQDTIDFAKRLDLTSAVFHITTPFPGTDLFGIASKSGELRGDAAYNEYMLGFSEDVPYTPKGLTPGTIRRFQHKAYREFYVRPRFVLRSLREIKSFSDIRRYAAALSVVKNLN